MRSKILLLLMKPILLFVLLSFLILGPASTNAQPASLEEARAKARLLLQAYVPDSDKPIEFAFSHQRHRFGDFFLPWQTDTMLLSGHFRILPQEDPLFCFEDFRLSPEPVDSQRLFYQPVANEVWTLEPSIRDLGTQASDFYLFQTLKYTPALALRLFLDTVKAHWISYRPGPIDTLWFEYLACPIKIYWNAQTLQVQKIEYTRPDLSLGNRDFEVRYFGHLQHQGAIYPLQTLTLERGIIKDRVQMRPQLPGISRFRNPKRELADLPAHAHRFPSGNSTITKYNDYIYFIDMEITGTRTMVVSFKDYFLVVGAPYQTNYGELIYMKIKEIDPAKFVRYFVPGHHHLPFMGGIRGFVRRGATILSPRGTIPYIKELVEAPHTIWKDLLSIHPSPLLLDSFENEITLKDENFSLRIVDMGSQSQASPHYLLFYFPEMGFLFQQDLARVPKSTHHSKEKHPGNQILRDYILDAKWNVHIIAQGYPLADSNWKDIYFFGDLMKAP